MICLPGSRGPGVGRHATSPLSCPTRQSTDPDGRGMGLRLAGFIDPEGVFMPLRMRVHDREHIGAALRRFKKLMERSGLLKQLRKRKYYEKPCELRRRKEL